MTRLPSVGGDNGTWGDVLNDFLTQSHNGDGTLRANSVGAPQLKPNSVTNAAIADASVSAAKLATAGQADGVATLDSSGTIPEAQLPARLSDASLTATYATAAQGSKADAAIPAAQMGAASGVATLDGSGLLPDAQVPSRLSAAELAATIATTTGYVLVASDTAPADTTRYGVPVLWLDTNEVIAAVPVNPPVPTWNDATSQFTVPSGVVGVDYVWTSGGGGIGAKLTQGATESTSGSFPRSVVITPVAQAGYALASGVVAFKHDFYDPTAITVVASDAFTGGPVNTIYGRTPDNSLGGTLTSKVWENAGNLHPDPNAPVIWGIDASGQCFQNTANGGAAGVGAMTGFLVPGVHNLRLQFDIIAMNVTVTNAIDIAIGRTGTANYNYSMPNVGVGIGTNVNIRGQTSLGTPPLGTYVIQLYENTLTLKLPDGRTQTINQSVGTAETDNTAFWFRPQSSTPINSIIIDNVIISKVGF